MAAYAGMCMGVTLACGNLGAASHAWLACGMGGQMFYKTAERNAMGLAKVIHVDCKRLAAMSALFFSTEMAAACR